MSGSSRALHRSGFSELIGDSWPASSESGEEGGALSRAKSRRFLEIRRAFKHEQEASVCEQPAILLRAHKRRREERPSKPAAASRSDSLRFEGESTRVLSC